MLTAPERVTVTVPEDIKDLFAWLKNYDKRFEGKDASIAAFLIKKGAEACYAESIAEAEPLDSDVADALNKLSNSGLSDALNDSEESARRVASGRR